MSMAVIVGGGAGCRFSVRLLARCRVIAQRRRRIVRKQGLGFNLIVLLLMGAVLWWAQRPGERVPSIASGTGAGITRQAPAPVADGTPSFLPAEAQETLGLIARGGPFPNRQDGSVFGNREGRLPDKPRGYYHEYTVSTPGASNRGTRRIITGGTPPTVYYYTDDHYETFRRFQANP
jgi:guanyl-specific ribonuclease Sa